MKNRFTYLLIAIGFLMSSTYMLSPVQAKGKNWTITERQKALSAKVDKGEKSMELTKKEADKLRSRLSSVNDKIDKSKEKNGGKLSYKDQNKVEKMLNGISVDIDKYELQKRTQH